MKNKIFKFRFITAFVCFIFCALINTNGFAQCTTPSTLSGKTFRSQAEINQFESDYSHLGCVFITGNVVIQGNDIVSLAGLGVISQIQGFLLIDRTGLTSLNGLQNLTSVGGNLNVFANPYLVTLVGLTGVTNISGTLEIRDNPLLTHMMYGSVSGPIVVTPLVHVNDVIIRNNPRLLTLQGLAYLTSINGLLWIADCPVLTSLQGLNNLNNVGALTIEGLTALTDLHGLEAIQTVVGGLRIAGNYNITSLRGLINLTSAGATSIMGNFSLTNVNDLSHLTSITGLLIIYSNAHLTSLAGLYFLRSINGSLTVSGNPLLTNLIGLDNIDYRTIQSLDISNNVQLTYCTLGNICAKLVVGSASSNIADNATDCNTVAIVLNLCGYYQTSQSGNWNTPSTWRGNVVPPTGSSAQINPSHSVIVNSPISVANLNVLGQITNQSTVNVTGILQVGNTTAATSSLFDNQSGATLSTENALIGLGRVNNAGICRVNCRMPYNSNAVHSPAFCLQSGAILGGNGVVRTELGCQNITSSLVPGCSPGGLTLTGNLTYSGAVQVDINGTTARTDYDVMNFTGSLTLGSGASLQVVWGFTPVVGNTFTVLTCGSLSGQFTTVTIPSVSGLAFNVVYNPTSVVITVVENIPTSQTAQSGPWHLTDTWVGGIVPLETSAVTINAEHTVTVTTAQPCRSLSILGTLNTQTTLGQLSVGSNDIEIGNNREVNVVGTLNITGGSLTVGGKVVVASTGTLTMNLGAILINGKNTTVDNSIAGALFKINAGATFNALRGTIMLSPHFNVGQNLIDAPYKFYDPATVQTTCAGVMVTLYSRSPTAFTLTGSEEMELFNLFLDHNYDRADYYLTAVKVRNALSTPFGITSNTTRHVQASDAIINGNLVTSSFGIIYLKPEDNFSGTVDVVKPLTTCLPHSFIRGGSLSFSALNLISGATPNNVTVGDYTNALNISYLDLAGGTIKFGMDNGEPDVSIESIRNGDATHHIKQGNSRIAVDIINPITVPLVHKDNGNIENYAPINLAYSSPFPVQGSAAVLVSTTTVTDIPANKAAIKHAWAIEQTGFYPPSTMILYWNADAETNPAFAAGRADCQIYQKDGTTWTPITTVAGPTSVVNGLYQKQVTLGELTGTPPFIFTVMTEVAPTTITTAQNGSWHNVSTWVNGLIPRAIDDAIIDHAVDIPSGTANCNNLTINATKQLDQRGTLIIGSNLTINGTFNHAFDPFSSPLLANTQIGATSGSSAAGERVVNVSGTLSLGNNILGGGFFLAGRMVFNTGSTLDLKNNFNLTLTGWSGGTPQYLMDIDNLMTLNANINVSANLGVNVTHGNGTQPIISTGRNFVRSTCNFSTTPLSFNLSANNDYYFGGATRRSILPINLGANANLYLNNTTMARLTANNGMSVHSTGGQFSNIDAGGGTTMYGDFTLVDDCNPAFPVAFNNTGALSFDPNMVLNVNVTNSVDFNIPTGVTQKLFGTLNAQSGKIIVKGGTLDLRGSSTMVNNLSNTRYFETQLGTGIYSTLGSVLLPSTGSTPVNFNLGITIPNLSGGGTTSVSAPVNIVSNNGNCNIFVNVQQLALPAGFTAPLIQWDISPVSLTTASPSLTMTFTWPLSAETYAFAISRVNARVYHWNGTIWEPLVSEPAIVNVANQTVSMRVQNVTSFSPFMVGVLNTALSAELIDFKAKINGNNAQLTWQTASEINVKNFDIEKSLDGQKFGKFAEVKANNTPSVYQAFDDQFSVSAYYRLKINELDGRFNFSKVVYLEKNTEKSIKIRRDTEGSLLVETDDKIELILVTNTIGQVVKSTKDKQLSINDLNAGIYLISVKTDKGFLSQKVFKE